MFRNNSNPKRKRGSSGMDRQFAALPRLRFGLLFSLVLFAIACAGCSPAASSNSVPVKGTLTDKSGRPLAVAGREIGTGLVTLTFIPVKPAAEGEQTFAATADASGKFDLPGGMPAGDY